MVLQLKAVTSKISHYVPLSSFVLSLPFYFLVLRSTDLVKRENVQKYGKTMTSSAEVWSADRGTGCCY